MDLPDPEKSFLFRCKDLIKIYDDDVVAINNVSISIDTSNLGLFGPNGSGKSTFIKLLLGLIFPTSGSVELGVHPEDIRFVPDFPILPQNITIDEWMATLETIYGDVTRNIDLQDIMRLEGTLKLDKLSAGQRRLAALLPLFYGKPKLIILDEPTNFLDMLVRERILKLIKEQLVKTKSKLILSSHRADEVNLFVDEVLLLKEGKFLGSIPLKQSRYREYSIVVENFKELEKYFKRYKIKYEYEDTVYGESIKFNQSNRIWRILDDYTKKYSVISFDAVDRLKSRLTDLI
ncbi:MAG: ATP-binding cassette domain-containing protein [Candidatus Kariarchaeaceae archaeon]|jgi:ABC-2 type transport system ATP-binding protein